MKNHHITIACAAIMMQIRPQTQALRINLKNQLDRIPINL